jgi:hypothetical protein
MARQGIENFVGAQKKFLDAVAEQVTVATEGGGKAATKDRSKALAELAHEGADRFIEAQKQLLELALEWIEEDGKTPRTWAKAGSGHPAGVSWAEVTQKSVKNFVAAQKSLLDLAVRPVKAAQAPAAKARPKRQARAKAARA